MKILKEGEGKKVICIKECYIHAIWLVADGHNCSIGEVFFLYEEDNGRSFFYFLDKKLAGKWDIVGIEEYFIDMSLYRNERINEILND